MVAYLKEHSLEFPGVRVEKAYLRRLSPRHERAVRHARARLRGRDLRARACSRSSSGGSRPGRALARTGSSYSTTRSCVARTAAARWRSTPPGGPRRVLRGGRSPARQEPGADHRQRPAGGRREGHPRGDRPRAHGRASRRRRRARSSRSTRRTGEILAMTSYPDYDPSLWVGGMKQTDFDRLNDPDAHNPLFNRAISGSVSGRRPPSSPSSRPRPSTRGLIDGKQVFNDPGYFKVGQQVWHCWKHGGSRRGQPRRGPAWSRATCTSTTWARSSTTRPVPCCRTGCRQFGFGQDDRHRPAR